MRATDRLSRTAVHAVLLAALASPAWAQEAGAAADPAVDLFARKCASCHTVGKGPRVGPDLKGTLQRRERPWVERLIKAPSTMLDSDPMARQLVQEFGGIRMPDLGLTDADARALAALIERCSAEPCDLQGRFVPVTQATAADVARGREMFLGRQALAGGAGSCLSCHTVRGAGAGIPGGTLARDLTNAYARLGDQGLDAALRNPAFPVMGRVFAAHPLQPDEAFALRAFLHDANRTEPAPEAQLSFPLAALLAAAAALAALNAAWSRRLRGVRRPLTERGH